MTAPTARPRFAQIKRKLSAINGAGAGVICVLVTVAIWGRGWSVGVVAAIQVAMIAFNQWLNRVYLPRHGRYAELLRTVFNAAAWMVTCHVAAWPLPVWLWLPFIALTVDHLNPRAAKWSVATICVALDCLALWEGVNVLLPVSFTLGAFFCLEVSRLRFGAMREMLEQSDAQRLEIEHAHAQLSQAHECLEKETHQRLQMEVELRQAQKLEAVGRLASGIAHELNTPVQFVSDSLHFVRDGHADLRAVVEKLREVGRSVLDGSPSWVAAEQAAELEETADLPYLLENVPLALDRSLDGLNRVATIVRSMKEFAHPGTKEMAAVDLNRAIASTLTIARSEYKYVADVETHYEELPPVVCQVGEINQVVLNVLVNAAHAIGDVVKGTEKKGLIRVRTRCEAGQAVIEIGDTGGGIPEAIKDRVFDPFFTTKEVGRGSGQGLAIARSVVVDQHHGTLNFESRAGEGTTFFIRIPLEPGKQPAAQSGLAA